MNLSTNISKTISYALRHKPEEFGLELDDQGWVSFDDLYEALVNHDQSFKDLDLAMIKGFNAKSSKPRFQIKDGFVRAAYGHSFNKEIKYSPAIPPEILYHGTTISALEAIKQSGLKPMTRQYVHLTDDPDIAILTAKRRSKEVVLLKVRALEIIEDGFELYNPGNHVWLVKKVDSKYVEFMD